MKKVSSISYHIFDHGNEFADRYTLVSPDGNVYSFSDDPYFPTGIGQFSHNCDGDHSEYTFEGKLLYVQEMQQEYKELNISELPKQAQKFVKEKIKNEVWECTDASTGQYCLTKEDGIYIYRQWDGDHVPEEKEMVEKFWDMAYWHIQEINFSDIDDPEEEISGYYESLEEVKKLYPENWKQIVCECHFENQLPAVGINDGLDELIEKDYIDWLDEQEDILFAQELDEQWFNEQNRVDDKLAHDDSFQFKENLNKTKSFFVAKRKFSDGEKGEDQRSLFTNKYYPSKKWGAVQFIPHSGKKLAIVKSSTFSTKKEALKWAESSHVAGSAEFFDTNEQAFAKFIWLKEQAK